jgi:hypothetical protein
MNCDRPKDKLVMKNKSKHLIGQIIKHYIYVPKLSCQNNLQKINLLVSFALIIINSTNIRIFTKP